MAHDAKGDLKNLLDASGHHLTRCFRVTRKDGEVHRFTNHDQKITFTEGWLDASATDKLASPQTYTPVDSWDASNARAESAMKKSNIDLMGAFGGSVITKDDILAGLWNWAILDDFIVDARYPFKGAVRHNKYRLTDFVMTDNGWVAQANTMTSEMYRKSGKVFSDTCWHALGDSMCGIDMDVAGSTHFKCTVDSSALNRKIEFADISGSHSGAESEPKNMFKSGHIKWLTGNNKGQLYPVRASSTSAEVAVGMLYVYWVITMGEFFNITDSEGTTFKFVFIASGVNGSSGGTNIVNVLHGNGTLGTAVVADNITSAINGCALKVTASEVTDVADLPNNHGDSSVTRYVKLTQDIKGEAGNTEITESSTTNNDAFKVYNFGENGLSKGLGVHGDEPTVHLQYPTRADITDGDTFSLFMGCDKLKETCKARPTAGAESSAPGTLGNFLNFGGFTFLVGTTTLIKTGEYRNS
tara:strand:+ start:309 stop:1718 length:1410 start_codon:yes stop_codon:yes gene_type:complete